MKKKRAGTKEKSNPEGSPMVFAQLRAAIVVLCLFTAITGVLYPLVMTGIAQLAFPDEANGSLIMKDGKSIGSGLIGQSFSDPKYFWGRPSATAPFEYNAAASSGSNLGPLNPVLVDGVQKRIKDLRDVDPRNAKLIPVDLVTASGSGLDPHISVAAALYQLPRVARHRDMSEEDVRALVDQCTEGRQVGFLGEARVNILKLNLALDRSHPVLEAR